MPMTKEEKAAKAKARREAAKAAKQQQTAEVTQEVTDAEPTNVESAVVSTGPVNVDGQFVNVDAEAIAREREQLVIQLIDTQCGVDRNENQTILSMIEACRIGADPKEFCNAYAMLAKDRMKADTVKSRKSNLMGVLTYAVESQPYLLALTTDEANSGIGLQAMYKLRQAMLKGPETDKPKRERKVKEEVAEDDAPQMTPNDLMLHQINNAIDAAVDAGFNEIAERLRAVFYTARAAIVDVDLTPPKRADIDAEALV